MSESGDAKLMGLKSYKRVDMRNVVFAAIACLVFIVGLAAAQSKNGTLYGTVRDTSEHLLPGATILLNNIDTKAVSNATTNEAGEYRIEVPPGTYQLFADLHGFDAVRVNYLRLNENETIKQELILSAVRQQNPLRRIPPQGRWIPEQ